MNCKNCNEPLNENAKFCRLCGEIVDAPPQNEAEFSRQMPEFQPPGTPAHQHRERPAENSAPAPAKQTRLLPVVIALSVLLILAVAFIVGILYNNSKEDDVTTTAATTVAETTAETSVPVESSSGIQKQYIVATQTDDLRIREGAGTGFAVVGTIPKNTVVTVTAIQNGWGFVGYQGKYGWCSMEFLREIN